MFRRTLSTSDVVRDLATCLHVPLRPNGALVLFSRVRRYPTTHATVGFLIRSKHFSCIRANSLLNIGAHRVASCPIKFRRRLHVCPLSFRRFYVTGNIRRRALSVLHDRFRAHAPIPAPIRSTVVKLFRACLIINNVPSIIRQCISARSVTRIMSLRGSLLTLCQLSVTGCTRAGSHAGVHDVFSTVPSRLSSGGHEFMLTSLSGATHRGQCTDDFL